MLTKTYWIYILTNRPYGTLYVGVTNNLGRRLFEHKHKLNEGFTKQYNLGRLVYCETTTSVSDALNREKQLKKWNRDRKIELIEGQNPNWDDLSEELQT